VKEQSHKEEMSAAIRGDFQRLRARGVSAALVPQEDAEPPERSEPPESPEPEPPPAEQPAAHGPRPPLGADGPEDRSWLSRLVGR
jgi:hypothetical protein